MHVMARVLFALLLQACLVTLTLQRPANQQHSIELITVCDDGRCRIVEVKKTAVESGTKEINVLADEREVSLAPGQETTLTCHVSSKHSSANVRTAWYSWVVANNNAGEWKWQRALTSTFDGSTMTSSVTGDVSIYKYKCEACVTDQPASAEENPCRAVTDDMSDAAQISVRGS